MQKEPKHYYESILAAAIMKYKELTPTELIIIADAVKERFPNEVCFDYKIPYQYSTLRQYIVFISENEIHFYNSVRLDSKLSCSTTEDGPQETVEGYLKRLAGKEMLEFFKSFNLEEAKKKYIARIEIGKERFKKEGKVLLLGDEREFEILTKHGFENIDFIPSTIRATKYFIEHPEQFENYNLIFLGDSTDKRVFQESYPEELSELVYKMQNEKNIIIIHLSTPLRRLTKYYGILEDTFHNVKIGYQNFYCDKYLDVIIECSLYRHLHELDSFLSCPKNTITIDDNLPSLLPLPTKKKDLRIMYVEGQEVNSEFNQIPINLGLNVNHASSLHRIKNMLGEYDIIISHEACSFDLINLYQEAQQQCKDTGRQRILLITYYTDPVIDSNAILFKKGDRPYAIVGLSYKIVTRSSVLENNRIDFRLLLPKDEKLYKPALIKAVLESAVTIYSQSLDIEDISLKSPQVYEEEYKALAYEYDRIKELPEEMRTKFETEQQEKLAREKAPLNDFEHLKKTIISFLRYKQRGLIQNSIPDLKIYKLTTGIVVERYLNGKLFCKLTLNDEDEDDLKVFNVQTASRKGNLFPPETVAIYSKEKERSMKEGLIPTIKKPDENQNNALVAIMLKVKSDIEPLITESLSTKLILNNRKDK